MPINSIANVCIHAMCIRNIYTVPSGRQADLDSTQNITLLCLRLLTVINKRYSDLISSNVDIVTEVSQVFIAKLSERSDESLVVNEMCLMLMEMLRQPPLCYKTNATLTPSKIYTYGHIYYMFPYITPYRIGALESILC